MKLPISAYYRLTKPGIIRGNLVSTVAGFFLASRGQVSFGLLLAIIAGTALVIACGCAINNYLDRSIDKKMNRTQKRALVTGEIPVRKALLFAGILGLLGLAILVIWVNMLTAIIGFVGLFFYVVIYGIGKRTTVHGTLIGSISGAIPPVAGYTAVANQLDTGALLLFLVLTAWQMPHFYAIAMFRLADYKAAGLPVLPAVKGIWATKVQILVYIGVFVVTACLFTVFGYTSILYAAALCLTGVYWVYHWFVKVKSKDYVAWAGNMFAVSLVTLWLWAIAISVDSFFTNS